MMHFPKTRRGEVVFRCVKAAAMFCFVHCETRAGQRAANVGFAVANGMMFGHGRDPEVEMMETGPRFLRSVRHMVPGFVFREAVSAKPKF